MPVTLHSGSPALQIPQDCPRPGLILLFQTLPSGPSHLLHMHTQTFITKSFFIEGWVRDRTREALGAIPWLAGGSGVGLHPASSRAPQGEAWPPAPG